MIGPETVISIYDLAASTRSPATTRIWKERKATSCDSVTRASVL